MPIIKSAKKRMRQNAKNRARNFPVRSKMKSVFKSALEMIKDGKYEEAAAIMPRAYSVIDMACKKNIIHKKNAARKKSRLAQGLNDLATKNAGAGGAEKTAEPKAKVEKVEAEA